MKHAPKARESHVLVVFWGPEATDGLWTAHSLYLSPDWARVKVGLRGGRKGGTRWSESESRDNIKSTIQMLFIFSALHSHDTLLRPSGGICKVLFCHSSPYGYLIHLCIPSTVLDFWSDKHCSPFPTRRVKKFSVDNHLQATAVPPRTALESWSL